MRSWTAVAIFITFAGHVPAQGPCHAKTTLDYGLHGAVRSVREPYSRMEFDARGRELENAHATNGQYQVFRYLYSPNGLDYEIQMFEASSLQGDKKPVDFQRHTAKFDALGRCVEEQDFDTDGSLNGRTTYQYFLQSVIRETSYDYKGKLFAIEDHEYDSAHHIVWEKSKQFEPSIEWIRKYLYNELGQQTDVFWYRKGALDVHYVSTYDVHGLVTSSEVITSETQLTNSELHAGKTSYQYDSHGNIIQEADYNGVTTRSSFSYDSHSNWIEQVNGGSQKPVSITYRQIEYSR